MLEEQAHIKFHITVVDEEIDYIEYNEIGIVSKGDVGLAMCSDRRESTKNEEINFLQCPLHSGPDGIRYYTESRSLLISSLFVRLYPFTSLYRLLQLASSF